MTRYLVCGIRGEVVMELTSAGNRLDEFDTQSFQTL
jgi:hypothetical protein